MKSSISTKISDVTIKEVKEFTKYAQLFLEKDINIIDLLDKLAIKVIGKSLSDDVIAEEPSSLNIESNPDQLNLLPVDSLPLHPNISIDVGTIGVVDPDFSKEKPTTLMEPNSLIKEPMQSVVVQSFANKLVTVICCENIEGNNNPKVRKLGPYFKARVLEDLVNRVKVQITENGFDPYVFIVPKEDVELVP